MERTEFKSHISGQYNQNLEDLFNLVLEMGGLVETQLTNTLEAVKGENRSLAKEVKLLDKVVNKEELEIDRICATVLARQQPAASDLRLIVSAIRLAVDLERIGDEVVNVSKLAVKMSKVSEVPSTTVPGYKQLIDMVSIDIEMLKNVLSGFAALDAKQFADMIDDDNRVIEIKNQAYNEIKEALNQPHEMDADYMMQMIHSVRAAERISAHIVNMGESIVYLINGNNARKLTPEKFSEFLKGL